MTQIALRPTPFAFPQFAIRNPQFEIIFPLPPTSNREAHLPYAL
jgi:hypothetical protein